MDQPKVVIIILNYNSPSDTLECIYSVQKNDYSNYQIILIDNCSTDRSWEIFEEKLPETIKFKTDFNNGYTGGINFGFQKAYKFNPKFILVLNNDTIVTKTFLTELVNSFNSFTHAAAAGGLILAEHDRKTIWYCGGKIISWRGLAMHKSKGENYYEKSFMGVEKTEFITGCMIMFDAKRLEEIGFEDERFFMYLDDIELSRRISVKNFDLLFVPTAIIYHKILNEKESPFKLYYSVRNRLLLISKAFPGFTGFCAKVLFVVIIGFKMTFWSIFNKKFFNASSAGLSDYFKKKFFAGRGHQFYKL